MIFLSFLGLFFADGSPPDDTVDDEGNVIPEMEGKYKTFKKQEKIKFIVGYIVTFLVVCFCLIYINLLAAVLGEGPAKIWFFCFVFGVINDFLILQPFKCFLYFICTRQEFLRIMFDICSGALNIGSTLQLE